MWRLTSVECPVCFEGRVTISRDGAKVVLSCECGARCSYYEEVEC